LAVQLGQPLEIGGQQERPPIHEIDLEIRVVEPITE